MLCIGTQRGIESQLWDGSNPKLRLNCKKEEDTYYLLTFVKIAMQWNYDCPGYEKLTDFHMDFVHMI